MTPNQPAPNQKKPFEEIVHHVEEQIAKRRSSWKLQNPEWEDVAQELLIRSWAKYDLYDPRKAPLEHWLNRLFSNALFNLNRDHCLKFSRPCIGGDRAGGKHCTYNRGGDCCAITPSGKQCSECKFYSDWERRKGSEYNIKASVSIENHVQEASSVKSEFLDIEGKKQIIDARILEILKDRKEIKMYKMLYIKHLTTEEVGEALNYKPSNGSRVAGYQTILKFQKKIKTLARKIIDEDGLT